MVFVTYVAETFLRSCQLCSHSRTWQAFWRTRRFITVFTRALHWSLSWARSIQSIPPQPVSPRTISILSTHLRTGLSSGHFLSSFRINILYAFLFSLIRATCIAHHILLGEEYKLWSISLCSFLQSSVISSLFGPNIHLRTLFSNTLSPC
jgi:hypothetical protein